MVPRTPKFSQTEGFRLPQTFQLPPVKANQKINPSVDFEGATLATLWKIVRFMGGC